MSAAVVAAIKVMRERGIGAEDALAIIEAIATADTIEQPKEVSAAERKREADRVRIAAKREAERNGIEDEECRATSRDNGATSRDTSLSPEQRSPTPPKTQTPISPSPKPPSGEKGVPEPANRGSRLAADWRPSETDRAYARQLGATDPEIDRQAERFRNHWHGKSGKDAVKVSWPATWRNWCLNAQERGDFRSGAPPSRRDPHATLFTAEKRI